MDLLVMENVFYERSLSPVYDLKGSERARWCKDDPSDPTTVLLDENLKRSILSAPLLVSLSYTARDPSSCAAPDEAIFCLSNAASACASIWMITHVTMHPIEEIQGVAVGKILACSLYCEKYWGKTVRNVEGK